MLVGRDAEIQRVQQLIGGARVAHSGVLVVVGEAGAGKTALLDHIARTSDEVRVLRADVGFSERDVGFAGLHQVLLPLLDQIDRLPGPQSSALSVALALRSGPAVTRFAVGAAALGLLTRCARDKPALIIVDSADLLDQPSADALVFVCRRLMADPIAVLFASRPGPDVPILEAGFARLPLPGLPLSKVAALLTELTGTQVPTTLATLVHRATAGNPLAVTELAGCLDDLAALAPVSPVEVPDRVMGHYARRITGLEQATREALLIAAIAGPDPAVLDRALHNVGSHVDFLTRAEDAGLVKLQPTGIEFVHPLARSSAYSVASPPQRRAAHQAVADAQPESDPDRRAWHRSEATVGVDDDVGDAMAGAGRRAVNRGAYAVAASAYERAAMLSSREPLRGARLCDAGEAAWFAGQISRARTLLKRAAAASSNHAKIDAVRGNLELRSGSLDRAAELFRGAANDLTPGDPDAAAMLLADLINTCFLLGDTADALAAARQLEHLLASTQSRYAAVRGRMTVGIAHVIAGTGGVDHIRSAVEELESGPWWSDDLRRPGWMVLGTLFLRESVTGRKLVDRVVQHQRDRCALGALPGLLFLIARDDAGTDRWEAALSGYQESVALARESQQSTDLAMSLAGRAWLLARTGHGSRCREDAAEATALADRHHIHLARAWALAAEGDLELGLGRPDTALSHFNKLSQYLDEIGLLDVDMSPGPEIVEALLRLGRPDDAANIASGYLAAARHKGQPWALARAIRAQAMVAADEDADTLYVQALRLHSSTSDVFEDARTRLARGARLRRGRHRAAARPELQEALSTFERLGSWPWAEQAATELAAAGSRPQRRGDEPLDRLTFQELQIARLLGSGRTTREAAAALFLSAKTVEYHLRHVYSKLGIRSRSELAAALARDRR